MSEETLPKAYDPAQVEKTLYAHWEQQGYFAASGDTTKPPYCIMIPPPNVTGSLHMGHAFQDTLMDGLIRYHRMKGDNTLWQTGTDHAGIATQMVVERQLAADGKSRHDLGRDAFIEKVWDWKKTSGGTIVKQLRRLAASCDWERERFTMDEGLSEAVKEVFVRLYEEELIYRGKRLVNWDPVLHTALSDLEVLSEEEESFMWHMCYPLADGSGHLVVATTRPETMLGDTAVAVHPEDERYKHLIGKMVELPLTGRQIPVVGDEYADPEMGTGCVKITPAHDFNDYEVGKRHDLPMINVLTVDAAINDEAPEAYRGLDRYEARKRIIKDLEDIGLMDKIVPHKLMVPRGDRSKAVVEPYLTDQWYVKAGPLAEEAVKCVEDGRIKFVPENWSKTYYEWMNNIQDWCISRQIWWGHRIPAWYGPDGSVFVARSVEEAAAAAEKKFGKPVELTQDDDVLDTWFSSALWPFSTLGWPEETPELKAFYPTNVLVTAFDIIFFWVARMIMMGLKFTGEVPFHTVYVTGLVRDHDGHKMSKSKGNILDPLDLIDGIELETLVEKRTRDMMQPHLKKSIEKLTRKEFPKGIPPFGTDALRFTMASLATQGRDIKFDLNRVEGYRNFVNKIWNASRFVLMNTEGKDNGVGAHGLPLSEVDRWILSKLKKVEGIVVASFDKYRFDEAATALYHFLWGSYCDWYLELVKPVIYGEDVPEAEKIAARRTMLQVLETSLRLLHPIMPFVTEELWRKIAPLAGTQGKSIMLAPWPDLTDVAIDDKAETDIEEVMGIVTAVRNIRGEMDIPPSKRLTLLVQGDETDLRVMKEHESLIMALARLEAWHALIEEVPDGCATAMLGDLKLFIPLKGLVDIDAEEARLTKAIAKLDKDLEKVKKKLGNPNFVEKAKPEAVLKERAKEAEMEGKRNGLAEALEKVLALRGDEG